MILHNNTISNLELFTDARKAQRLLLMNLTAAAVLTADWRENVHYFIKVQREERQETTGISGEYWVFYEAQPSGNNSIGERVVQTRQCLKKRVSYRAQSSGETNLTESHQILQRFGAVSRRKEGSKMTNKHWGF